MRTFFQRQLSPSLCLGVAACGGLLYLSGLAATLQLGDAALPGKLLIPALPMPLYIVMAVVMGTSVGITMLAALRQRRRRQAPESQQQPDAQHSQWQTLLSTLGTLALLLGGLVWLMRHTSDVQYVLDRLRLEVGLARHLLDTQSRGPVEQIHSPATGYTLFTLVLLVYGGIGLLGVWLLCEHWRSVGTEAAADLDQPRQVRRAVAAGLHALHFHADPREAIIACYARLEHLLEDHGLPAAERFTPQEYMGEALRELPLPLDAFMELVQLFELARYSLHPLDQAARTRAIACLACLDAALTQEVSHAVQA